MSSVTGTRVDGRTVLRVQRREAIVAATRDLAATSGPDGFTVDDVAAAAGVSRRTVFNHFPTSESMLVAVCEDVLAQVNDQVLRDLARHLAELPSGRTREVRALDALGLAFRDADLPSAMATIVGLLGERREGGPRPTSQTALDHVGDRLAAQVLYAVPDVDPVVLRLTVTFWTNGIGVIARHWVAEHRAKVTPASRRAWREAMAGLTDQVAGGYRAAARRQADPLPPS